MQELALVLTQCNKWHTSLAHERSSMLHVQEWDADMDVKNDEEEDSLADDFGGALSETMALKEENDREVSRFDDKCLSMLQIASPDLTIIWRSVSSTSPWHSVWHQLQSTGMRCCVCLQ